MFPIPNHNDHKTIHRAATEAFHRYRQTTSDEPRLYYVAIPKDVAIQFEFELHPTEMTPLVCINIADVKQIKLQDLRTYRSQADALQLAELFEADQFWHEGFYQAHPVVSATDRPMPGSGTMDSRCNAHRSP